MDNDSVDVGDFSAYFQRLREVVERINPKVPIKQQEYLHETMEILENKPSSHDIERCVKYMQELNDTLFNLYGVCDDIIDFQVCINKIRNYADITDEKEITTHAADGDFVQ